MLVIRGAGMKRKAPQLTDEAVYRLPGGTIILDSVVVDPLCRTFAYANMVVHGWYVFGADGMPIATRGPYDEVLSQTPVMSANGRVAYGARGGALGPGAQWFAVVDGKAGWPHDGLGAGSFSFGPLGQRFSYTAYDGGKWRLFIDRAPVLSADTTIARTFTFSPDERRWAIMAQAGGRFACFVDGQPIGVYDSGMADAPVFSPNSERIAFVGVRGGAWFLNADGAESKGFDGIGGFTFSPDSTGCAYAAQEDGKWFVVIDGQETKGFDDIAQSSPQYSMSGKSLVYGARDGRRWLVFRNGVFVTQASLLGTRTPRFVPGSEKVAVIEVHGDGMRLSIDGTAASATHKGIADLVFSQDGKRMAYAASAAESSWVQIVDGVRSATYEKVGTTAFSADGQHYAYRAWKHGKPRIVVDGVECWKGRRPWAAAPLAWDGNIMRTFLIEGDQVIQVAATAASTAEV
jgi:hypothetical protein